MSHETMDASGPRPGQVRDDVAEATAEALSAVQRILQRLLREADLTEDERPLYAKELEKIYSFVE
jgi:hypothetical protein